MSSTFKNILIALVLISWTAAADPNLRDYFEAKEKISQGQFEQGLKLLQKCYQEDPESVTLLYEISEVHIKMGNLTEASEQLSKLVEKQPDQTDYRLTYAGVLASLHEYDAAKKQYETVIAKNPGHAKASLLLGVLTAEMGNLEEALGIFDKSIEAQPDNFIFYFYRAKIYLDQDKVDLAKTDLEKCVQLKPLFTEAGIALALLYEKEDNLPKAIEVYEQMNANGSFKKHLAELYIQQNDLDKALKAFEAYLEMVPDDLTVRLKVGLIFIEQKKIDKSIAVFEKLLKEEPGAENVQFYLGAAYAEKKAWAKSQKAFSKVSKQSKYFEEAQYQIGVIYREQGKYEEGLAHVEKFLSKNPDKTDFYSLKASFFESQKKWPKAIKIVEDALKKNPLSERLTFHKAILLDKSNQKKAAIDWMKTVLEKDPENAQALNFVGYSYLELDENLEEAGKMVMRALELRPQDPFIQDSVGFYQLKKGNFEEAKKQFENALQKQPDEPVILGHLSEVHEKMGEIPVALEMVQRAQKLAEKRKDQETLEKLKERSKRLVKSPTTSSP